MSDYPADKTPIFPVNSLKPFWGILLIATDKQRQNFIKKEIL